jgi:DNA-binding NarL/FixJ family response regulator
MHGAQRERGVSNNMHSTMGPGSQNVAVSHCTGEAPIETSIATAVSAAEAPAAPHVAPKCIVLMSLREAFIDPSRVANDVDGTITPIATVEVTTMDAFQPTVRLLLADDHVLVAQGIERLLLESFAQVRTVRSGEEIVAAVDRGEVDLVVADISMEGMSGIEALREVRRLGHHTPFLFLTMHDSPEIAAEAVRAGASGYVLKACAGEELVSAITAVLSDRTYVTPTLALRTMGAPGHPGLTTKQRDILERVAQGLRSKQIAYELGLSVRTIESHKYAMMQALDVHSTVELVRKASRMGLVDGLRDAHAPSA